MSLYIITSLIIMFLSLWLYRRYFPIRGIVCKKNVVGDYVVVLDIRDYNEKRSLTGVSLQIPYAYLRRNFNEIPDEPLHVIATNRIDLNLGIRFLLKKGFRVSSFEILDCPCKGKGGISNGI